MRILVFSTLLLRYLVLVACDVCDDAEFQCNCRQLLEQKHNNAPMLLADCSARNIDTVPSLLKSDVNKLDLSSNKIEFLDPKHQKLSSDKLHVLVLRHNRIAKVDVEFFFTIPNLEELDLSHNSIQSLNVDLFQKSGKLTKLDLSYNKLHWLPDGFFKPLPHVTFLDLSYNPIGEFLEATSLTKNLSLSIRLKRLSLNGAGITVLPSHYFDHFEELQYISLADNSLHLVPVLPQAVTNLDLSGNNLSFLSARYLNYPFLKVLRLNRMESLKSIHHYAFYNLVELDELYIQDCPNLDEFSSLAFDVLSRSTQLNPSVLSLARNRLTGLNESYVYLFNNLERADLSGNPWRCNCSILWLQYFKHTLHNSEELRCHSPDRLKGKPILDLTDKDLQECFPAIYGKTSHRILIIMLTCSVIILCAVIFVLIRYPFSWLYGNRLVAPDSPYSSTATEDRL